MPTLRIHKQSANIPHFVTLTTIEWIDIFTKPEYFQVIEQSLEFCRKYKGLKVYEYVIMMNHIHLIISTPETNNLHQVLSDFKKYTTKKLWELLEKDNRKYIKNILQNSYNRKKGYVNQIWQRENYPEPIYTEKFLMIKIQYIWMNPVKKGYVSKPEDWLHCSANYWIVGNREDFDLDRRDG